MIRLAVLAAFAMIASPARAEDVVNLLHRGGFRSFSDAVSRAGLVDTLNGPGPLTVFAPSEGAFAALSQEERLLLKEDKAQMRIFVLRHVVNGALPDTAGPVTVESMSAEPLRIERSGAGLTVNGLPVTGAPARADNGVVYRIDATIPPSTPGTALP